MKRNMSSQCVLTISLLTSLLVACGGSNEAEQRTSATVSAIPQHWLTDTAEGWENSKGKEFGMTTVERHRECLVLPEGPSIDGEPITVDAAGWGPLDADGGYRYRCEIKAGEHIASSLSLVQLGDTGAVDEYVDNLLATGDSSVQENTAETLTASGAQVHVLVTEYITNPSAGRDYTAVYADRRSSALVELAVKTLDEDERERYSTQHIADDLMGIIAAAE